MSRYHKATHRANESYPTIVNHADKRRDNVNDLGDRINSTERALEKTKVSQAQFKRNQEMPKKVVHTNVSKATPDVQSAIKRTSKKTGKDTYEYTPKKAKKK